MIVLILVLMLLAFLAAFFGLDNFAQNVMQASDIRLLGISLLSPEFRAFLGVGILFLEFAVILFSMLDRIGDTVREAFRLVVRLLPFGLFLTSIWRTFAPILGTLLPKNVVEQAGIASTDASITQIVTSSAFSEGVLLTLGTMVLFIVTTYALNRQPRESAEVRALRDEIARYKRELRRGL